MPQYRCLQRTTLPGGGLALPGEVHELPENSHRKNVWEYVSGGRKEDRTADRAAAGKTKAGKTPVKAEENSDT